VLAEGLLEGGFDLVTGGTDNHLILMDLRNKGIPGWRFARVLYEAGIEANMNSVPGDTNPPLKPAGVRIGTPAVTTRGMGEPEMRRIARWFADLAGAMEGEVVSRPEVVARVRGEVLELTGSGRFPVPGIEC